MTILSELEVLQDVTRRLEEADFAYMLTGSLAMNFYAQPRMTRDIDLIVELGPGDATKLVALFRADYYLPAENLPELISDRGMFNLIHLESVVKVDMIVRKNTDYRIVEFKRREQIKLADFRTWITSREDLILSKLCWAKPSGSELQLRDARNLLNGPLDWEYLHQWAKDLNVDRLLEQCKTNHE